MRSPIWISIFVLAFASLVVAQSSSDSLADVARQSRSHAVAAKHSWNDQNSDFGRSTDDSATPCGAQLDLPDGYVSALLGKDNIDPDLAKALVHWLDKHPDLDNMRPDDIAKIVFPMNASQAQANLATAKLAAARFARESTQPSDPGAPQASSPGLPTYSTMAKYTLPKAVEAEQQRRARSDGSAADKLQEAVNVYSICESRRQLQFESDIDKLAKQQYQKRMTELTQAEPAKRNGSEPANGL